MATAQAPEEREAPVGLTAKGKARWMEIRARNALIVAINNETWGQQLSKRQAGAFAEFMRRFKLDISEIDNLGGRPYRNGRYYMRKTAELAAQGRVEWYKGEHIGPDARLDDMAAAGEQWAIDELSHRLRECIRLGVPGEAKVVYKVTVKMKELGLPSEGVKWWAPGRKKKTRNGEFNADPVGDDNPITSTETRAWRRAGRLYAAEIPELYAEEQEIEYAAAELGRAGTEEAEEAEGVEITPPVQVTSGPAQPIEIHRAADGSVPREQIERMATDDDPYTTATPPSLWAPDGGFPPGEVGHRPPPAVPQMAARVVVTRAKKADPEFQDDRDLVD